MIQDDDIKGLLTNVKKASKNNIVCDCFLCGKASHMYVKMKTDAVDRYGINKSYNFDCKHCGEHGRVFKLLEALGATHLIAGELVDVQKDLELHFIDAIQDEIQEPINLDLPTVKFPLGFKRIYENEYLHMRGFSNDDFYQDVIGVTDIVFKLEDYVIIGIYRDNELKGYLTRTTLNKQQIKAIEEERQRKYPRYRNSETEFTKLLGGYDEINFLTKTVILVEGYFDKKGVDRKFDLNGQNEIKCCFTFGKKISPEQIVLLLKKGVENIILLYDPDAIKEMKNVGFVLKKHFTVLSGYLRDEKDPDEATIEDLNWTFENLEEPWEFALNKVQILQL